MCVAGDCKAMPVNEDGMCDPESPCEENSDAKCISGVCTCPDCEDTFLDMVIVIDESGSVGPVNYGLTKDFVEDFLLSFTSNSYATIVEFSNSNTLPDAEQTIDWDDALTVASNVQFLTYRGGQTHTRAATIVATEVLENTSYGGNNRENVVIFVTDGVPCCGDPEREICNTSGLPYVEDLKMVADYVYIVAVGSFDVTQIECLVDNPSTDVFDVSNYNALSTVVETLK